MTDSKGQNSAQTHRESSLAHDMSQSRHRREQASEELIKLAERKGSAAATLQYLATPALHDDDGSIDC